MLTVIIPAYNEESVIDACLQSILSQEGDSKFEVIVAANGCSDRTVELATRRLENNSQSLPYTVLNLPEGNKNKALNAADKIARYAARVYLDADVICGKSLLSELDSILECKKPVFATGTMEIDTGRSFTANSYARIWRATPYIQESIPGCGCYAVNESGRKLWSEFPTIHSDDKFVRLLFPRADRLQVKAKYFWPMPQGLRNLLKVRIRWIRGNRQLAHRHPEVMVNDSARFKITRQFFQVVIKHPVSTIVFFTVYTLAALRAYIEPVGDYVFWSRAR